jgi:hypothetical protein
MLQAKKQKESYRLHKSTNATSTEASIKHPRSKRGIKIYQNDE